MVAVPGLRVAGLFAGIAGVERGLHQAGHQTELLCEIHEPARRVLGHHYADVPLHGDVRTLDRLPTVDLVAAGFPCQDLSQAGRTAGIGGSRSGLVGEVFRLVERHRPRWLLLENVPFMLSLDRGRAMAHLATCLRQLGYKWAYRVVDARSLGLPQRRQRVLLLASRTDDPRSILLAQDRGEPTEASHEGRACGFYWTEGLRGLGWAVDAVPTLKGGSTVGIPSPPAIWLPQGPIVTPDIRDAERLQGFPADWTKPATAGTNDQRGGARWKLVGNAVPVPLAKWVGMRLLDPRRYEGSRDAVFEGGRGWPKAAWSDGRDVRISSASPWPARRKRPPLAEFLRYDAKPLSARAASGFLSRARRGRLCFREGFLEAVKAHLENMQRCEGALLWDSGDG